MARPLTRAQALQNRAFLKSLARTGNVRLAAREVGAKYGTMQHRRRAHPAFAVRWDAALAFAQAHINAKGREPPKAKRGSPKPLRPLLLVTEWSIRSIQRFFNFVKTYARELLKFVQRLRKIERFRMYLMAGMGRKLPLGENQKKRAALTQEARSQLPLG